MIHKKEMCFASLHFVFVMVLSRAGQEPGLTCFHCRAACLVRGQPRLQTALSQSTKMSAWIYTSHALTHCQELDMKLAFFFRIYKKI